MTKRSGKKVLIIGLPFFAKKLAKNLKDLNPIDSFIPLDTNKIFLDKIKYVFHILTADTIYQIGGNAYLGGALSLAYFLRKRIVFHWVGTDVVMAKENFRLNTANKKFLGHVEHLCEVSWIKDELEEINVFPKIMQLACFDQFDESSFSFPEKFKILTYMTPGRETFYGLNYIVVLAQKIPDVTITILGISSYHLELPKNIVIGGWVQDMKKEYLDTCLYLRLPEHDGLSFSVLEALSFGRYVGYSQNLEGTEYIENLDLLVSYVGRLKNIHETKGLQLNFEGINFVKKNFPKDVVAKQLAAYLTNRV